MHQAERIGDTIAVFLDGEIVETGPPSVIFDSPEDERTEKFIGGELVY
jgi:tungstate transport system ATP-binding protein